MSFIARRIIVSVLILIAASFIMYVLTAYSGDPLDDLRQNNSPNRAALIAARTQQLQLDVPPPLRWFLWIGGAAKCVIPFANACDLGVNLTNAPITTILPMAMFSTIQLVTLAFLLALVLGIAVGIVTALRQYTGFDYSVTFISFFLFSLPPFLAAVMLKEFLAIGFNNFLQSDSTITFPAVVVIAVISALVWQVLIGGDTRRRLLVAGISGAATAIVLSYMSAVDWFRQPGLGPVGLLVLIAGVVFATTAIIAGLKSRRSLVTAAINGLLAYIAYFALQGLFDISSIGTLLFLGVATVVVGLASGFFVGGFDKGQAMRIGVITGVVSASLVLIDRFMQSWPAYNAIPQISGRPIATVGSSTPNLTGDVWITGLDTFTHLLLPTLALLLISFAGYTRYARAGLLDVLNQDYIRTARAKGLPERTVIVRHAFRNMLIPIATLIATDIGALLGGAIITERVFGISGMGTLFNSALQRTDVNPVMGYFIVIAIMAIAFNFLADLAYAALDPRVRTH